MSEQQERLSDRAGESSSASAAAGSTAPVSGATRHTESDRQPSQPPFSEAFDSVIWARAFVEHVTANPGIATDEGTMVGWFANALMRGWDERAKRDERTFQRTAELLAALKELVRMYDGLRDLIGPSVIAKLKAADAVIAKAEGS